MQLPYSCLCNSKYVLTITFTVKRCSIFKKQFKSQGKTVNRVQTSSLSHNFLQDKLVTESDFSRVRTRIFFSFATTFANLIFFCVPISLNLGYLSPLFRSHINPMRKVISRNPDMINDNSDWTVQKGALILGLIAL